MELNVPNRFYSNIMWRGKNIIMWLALADFCASLGMYIENYNIMVLKYLYQIQITNLQIDYCKNKKLKFILNFVLNSINLIFIETHYYNRCREFVELKYS